MPSAQPDKLRIEFDPEKLTVADGTDARTGLSAAVVSDGHLWLACDEGCRLDRFDVQRAGLRCNHHTTFDLVDLLKLPADPDEEADIEGVDVDEGWWWFVGSHSVQRKKAKKSESPTNVAKRLAETGRDGNRHLLARVPLVGSTPKTADGKRRAGALRATTTSSDLVDAIVEHDDVHLAPFVDIPGKDNGFDIEGLAVRGMNVLVGLRSPVLRGWCCVVELALESDFKGRLRMKGTNKRIPYRKHFLNLGGLGARDLMWYGDDLLILAGPSMTHDGPTEIWRWKNVKSTRATSGSDVKRLMVVPHGEGTDRAEAISSFERAGAPSVLVVFDHPGKHRLVAPASVHADIFRLP